MSIKLKNKFQNNGELRYDDVNLCLKQRHAMVNNADGGPILARIKNQYNNLPGSERKLADLIRNFPGGIASYSATELAGLAGVSKAAATRLFQRLGYSSYEQARHSARDEHDRGSPLYMLKSQVDSDLSDSQLMRHKQQELDNLDSTFEALDHRKMDTIVKGLIEAQNIWFLGFRNSHFLAEYARWQFLHIRGRVQLLPSVESSMAEQIVDLQKSDIVIAIGFRRRTPRFLQALKTIHAKGIPILYLTDPDVGISTNYAKWVLHAKVKGSGIFDSYPAAYSLIYLLSISMLYQAGAKTRIRIKEIEDMHTELHDFD